MAADGVVIGLNINALTVMAVVVPIKKHAAEACHKPVCNVTCTGRIVIVFFGKAAAQC